MPVRRLNYLLWPVVSIGMLAAASSRAQDPVAALKRFSDFEKIDLNRLMGGDVVSERGSLMNFPNGISGQTCFAVPVSAEETAKRLQAWNPSPYSDLKVFAFRSFRQPCELADFQALDFKSSQRPIRWLLEKTAATTAAKSDLNLTYNEAEELASCTERRADPAKTAECWAKLLFDRASRFQQKGLAGILPYEAAGPAASPGEQLHSMLLEQLAVEHEFLPILKKIGFIGSETTPSLTPAYYCTLFEANHHATLALGAVYRLAVGDHYQLADVQYYVSNDYYTATTLYEVWPIQVGEKAGALVWRGDFFSAPMLAYTKGTERIAYGVLMLQDIKKEIHCMQDFLKKER
jgi:hypothetical protein